MYLLCNYVNMDVDKKQNFNLKMENGVVVKIIFLVHINVKNVKKKGLIKDSRK